MRPAAVQEQQVVQVQEVLPVGPVRLVLRVGPTEDTEQAVGPVQAADMALAAMHQDRHNMRSTKIERAAFCPTTVCRAD